jgi:hypothetical protein
MSEESRFIGFTALLVRACFHARDDNSLSNRSPEQIAQVHSLVLGLLFRVPSLSSPALTLSGSGLTARVSTLFATSPGASTHSRTSQVLDTFRPQVLSTSRRLSPHSGLWACFIPEPRPGRLRSFRGFPSPRSDRVLFGTICPLAVTITCRSPGRILTATVGALGFEALIRAGARAPRGW